MDVGIVGIGTIGKRVIRELDQGKVPGVRVSAITGRDLVKAKAFAATLTSPPRVTLLEEMPGHCDLMIEMAAAGAVEAVVKTALQAGVEVMVLSCAALLDREDLFEMARQRNTRIHVPAGAIAGLDGLLAAAAGRIESVTMITRKPPQALRGSPGVERMEMDLDAVTEATQIFEGPVIEGVPLFPTSANIAAAVSMAGVGPRKTRLQVVVDPHATRNTHDVVVEGEFGLMRFHVENIPREEDPGSNRLTELSVLAYLKQLRSPMHLSI